MNGQVILGRRAVNLKDVSDRKSVGAPAVVYS